MAKEQQQAASPEAGATPKKKRGKLVIIAGALVFVLGGGGAGAWYFMRPSDPNAPKATEPVKPAVFLPLESFTVNLVAQDGQPQYLQAGLTLKLRHDVKTDVIKERMPEIRNRMLLVLSGKKANDLLPVSGKHKLANELSDAIREVLGNDAGLKSEKHAAAPHETAKASSEDAKPAAEGKFTDGKSAAEGKSVADGKATDTVKAAHAATSDVEVLFTSFIIQ
jgi:flagellar FliL protein